MARALFAWELGGDLGHARRSMQVAGALRGLGHEIAFAFSDLTPLAPLARERVEWFQAPVLAPSRTPTRAPLNASAILLNRGFGDAAGLAGALRAWKGLFALWKPDLLVADYAPCAMLGARLAGLQRTAIGSGFSTPPRGEPMPVLRSWIATDEGTLRHVDATLLASVRDACQRVDPRAAPPARAADLFEADRELLCTWPEVDCFGPRSGVDYLGPQDDPASGAHAQWGTGTRPRVFAYLKPRDPRFTAILEALRAVAGEAIVAAPGLKPDAAAQFSSGSFRVHGEALAIGPLLASADLCLCHSGPGIVARALEAGVPLALLPQQLEQLLVGRRAVSAGAGVMLAPEEGVPDLKAWLAQALARDDLRHAAVASPVRSRAPSSAAQRIAQSLEG